MSNSKSLIRMTVLSMFIAVGVVISPILRVEGMCPTAHLVNIVCSVFMGPWYSLLCASMIGIIRMTTMGVPPLALTGAVFGAFLSGFLYRISRGKLIFAFIGEVIGTGIIGAIMSYPVMTLLWGRGGLSWLFYVPSFILATLIGGSVAYLMLLKLAKNGMLAKIQTSLGTQAYRDNSSIFSNAAAIASLGMIGFALVRIIAGIVDNGSRAWSYAPYGVLGFFLLSGLIYYVVTKSGRRSMSGKDKKKNLKINDK